MQTTPIAQLGRRLRHTRKKTGSWDGAAVECHVNSPNGEPSRGLAFRIAYGYMPSDDLVRRLIFDGAIEKPTINPLDLSFRDRQSILLALRKKKPLPSRVSPKTVRQFNDWLYALTFKRTG